MSWHARKVISAGLVFTLTLWVVGCGDNKPAEPKANPNAPKLDPQAPIPAGGGGPGPNKGSDKSSV